MSDVDGFSLPTDAFVEILLRLPTTTRRLLRFVCKRWRDTVDELVPERHVTPKILAFFRETGNAFIFSGDQQDDGRCAGQQMWKFWSSGDFDLVGTCNGLLCLRSGAVPSYVPYRRRHDDQRIYSAITVLNPFTYQKIVIPQFEPTWDRAVPSKPHKFSFGYLPTTGKYKVVDVTCTSSSSLIDRVQVFTFTLSEIDTGSWREDERVTSFEAPPVVKLLKVPEKATCQLTNVHERLGVMVMRQHSPAARVDFGMLEDDGGHRHRRRRSPPRWSRRCSLMEPSSPEDGRWITSPQFTHGEYVLRKREADGATWLYRHRMGGLTKNDGGEKAQMWPLEGEKLMCNSKAES